MVVLPLLTVPLLLSGFSSYLLAYSSVNSIARDFLSFKADGITNYAQGQWNLLVENNLSGDRDMEQAAMAAIASYAESILRNETEAVLAVDSRGKLAIAVGHLDIEEAEGVELAASLAKANPEDSFRTIDIGGIARVCSIARFEPFDWFLVVSEERSAFYSQVNRILQQSILIITISILISLLALLFVTRVLTRPAEKVVNAMRRIIDSNDLSERVPVIYNDEIGRISHTFNHMLEALDAAYTQIKRFAFDAVVAQKRETKTRNIFQLYVPKDVIEQIFSNPEKMLVGDNRIVSVLFSDIRSFTTISEHMAPNDLVTSLNRFFSLMVDIIMARDGVVDKFIGDAIMAIFGAPVSHGNDALSSIYAGLEMSEALGAFNLGQKKVGAPEFHIGIGINYGEVTVGNIGCEKKMNYTVIGDMVNLASRLEGLTKVYREPILISHSAREAAASALPFRLVDKVAVKGKSEAVSIYTSRKQLTSAQQELWALHDEAIGKYFAQDFKGARSLFLKMLSLDPADGVAELFRDRCDQFIANPPPGNWNGVAVFNEK